MKYGYARVSTDDQSNDAQIASLEAAGAEKIFQDHGISGSLESRPQLDEMLESLEEGDEVIVWRLDRLGRSMQHVVNLVTGFGKSGVQFKSLSENIDTATASGELVFHIFASLAHFERRLISERTVQGMAAAKRRGATLGRPKKFDRVRLAEAADMVERGKSISEVARLFKVSRTTLWRRLNEFESA